jgi:UDP-N-acetylglucosamine 2-epimerase (non-hydrolysing)
MKKKILFVFGTRPEAIKIAPIINEFRKHSDFFECKVCVSGQHRDLLNPFLKYFEIKVDFNLRLMKMNQDLKHITIAVLKGVEEIIEEEQPDYILVQGDTTTSMAASLAAFYKNIKVAHVEAGLRTWNRFHPFPEEANRKIIDSLSDLFFVHTISAKENLLKEGVDPDRIEITGNTVIDSLLENAKKDFRSERTILEKLSLNGRKIILMTIHRRENFGEPIIDICRAIKTVASRYKNVVDFVLPLHPNPTIQSPICSILGNIKNIILTNPLEYQDFMCLLKKTYFIITDSGGLQEEAPSLGKPLLLLRKTTERPEGVQAGCVEMIGTNSENIVHTVSSLIDNKAKYERMARVSNPYGDGNASKRIVARFLME